MIKSSKDRLKELDKLEEYLKDRGIFYVRTDNETSLPYLERTFTFNTHQIRVYDDDRELWDAICHNGSYGYEQGLLEIMGEIVRPSDGDSVCGYLTADDVIERIEEKYGKKI